MRNLCLALGLCLAAAACGGGDDIKRGGAGESCTSSNDCTDPLICDRGMCAAKGATTTPDGGAPVTPTVLSGPGESCTKTADCVTGYRCFAAVCALAATPEPVKTDAAVINVVVVPIDAGAPVPTNPVLGGRGETCTVSGDCEKGLVCIPNGISQGLGVCDLADYGLTVGGKTCSAECEQNIDCCELPVGMTGSGIDGGTVAYNSCADLVKVMAQSAALPTTCADVPAVARECFLYKTYCDCATTNPWLCTAGQCSYTKACSKAGETLLGCPTQSRTSSPLSDCNLTTSKCAGPTAAAGCTQDDECVTRGTIDGAGPCVSNECVCVTDAAYGVAGACYRKCAANLDCAAGYVCDTAKRACKLAGGCTTDASCKLSLKNVAAKCVLSAGAATNGACKVPCKTDQDCSPSGLLSEPFNGLVCGNDGYCGRIGECNTSADCAGKDVNGTKLKMFCAAETSVATNPYASAVTASKP